MASESKPTSEQLQLPLSPYLTIEQVASLIGVPKSFIYRRTARGHGDPIPHYRLGGHLRFKLADIEEWIEAHRQEPETESSPAIAAAVRQRSSRRSTTPLRRREP